MKKPACLEKIIKTLGTEIVLYPTEPLPVLHSVTIAVASCSFATAGVHTV
jgi:hypothetical protein